MVRIISCHHFRGQRVGRCDEAVGVAVCGDTVIVALEHQINVYLKTGDHSHEHHASSEDDEHIRTSKNSPVSPLAALSTTTTAKLMQSAAAASSHKPLLPPVSPHLVNHDLGTSFLYPNHSRGGSSSSHPSSSPASNNKVDSSCATRSIDSIESDTDLRLSHSFSTIDMIHKMSYNEKGRYILCLEKRESSTNNNTNVRSYFNWGRDHGTKPMRARIAGLTSPTGAEPEEDSLMMVEIPLTSPATAVASNNLTGHIACLSAESIVNLFLFRAKEVTGRVKVHYYDFDRTYSVEIGFIPDQIYFVSNYLACMNSEKVHVFHVRKEEAHGCGSPQFTPSSPRPNQEAGHNHKQTTETEKVTFNPKNEAIRVYLPSITRANRKRRAAVSVNIFEDFQDEITSGHTKVVFSATNPGIILEDVLRVRISNTSGGSHPKFVELGMYPIRIKDHIGAVALMVCTQKEGYLYHLPTKEHCSVVRVASYPFTAPLISFAFDSVIFHALTTTGLESYTCRSLYYAIKDQEGIKPFLNDCPLHDDPPTLIGIRPFPFEKLSVRKMACNSLILCMLACSNSTNIKNNHTQLPAHEDSAWTIYTLDLPDIETIYDDMVKTANLQADRTSDSYTTLLCESYIVLKLFMDAHPESEVHIMSRYNEICKSLGLAYLRSSINPTPQDASVSATLSETANNTTLVQPTTPSAPDTDSCVSEVPSMVSVDISDDLVNKGVTYFLMGRCGVGEVFSPENWSWIHEPCNIPGFIRMIEVTFIKCKEFEIHPDNQKLLSPTLTPVLVEFLSNNGPQTLVDLVLHASFIRECNSRRLLHILQQLADARNYPAKETLAVILTLVTIGGVDLNTQSQVKDLLHKTNLKDLKIFLTKEMLLETRGQQTFLTDVAVCIISSDNQNVISEKLFQYLKSNDITTSIVLFAFAQALNVNTDTVLQHCITKCLIKILEKYTSDKLEKLANVSHLEFVEEFVEDEKRAIHLLVRTYLSNINFSSNIPNHSVGTDTQGTPHELFKDGSHNNSTPLDILEHNQIFGNICTCVNFLLSLNSPGGMLTPQSQNIATVHLFVNDDSRKNYIKLLSLLSHPVLSNLEGIKDIVLTYLYKNAMQVKPTVNSTLFAILQIFAETPEKATNMLLTKQPTTVMMFAKETFEKVPSKWKSLVLALKKRIQSAGSSNTAEIEIFATILESVYLHLANSLSPHQLEQVLDKETEESQKFYGICKRVELANNYANMVITVSSDYLNHK